MSDPAETLQTLLPGEDPVPPMDGKVPARVFKIPKRITDKWIESLSVQDMENILLAEKESGLKKNQIGKIKTALGMRLLKSEVLGQC